MLALLQKIKLLLDIAKLSKPLLENKYLLAFSFMVAIGCGFAKFSIRNIETQQSARHYQDVLRDSYIYRKIVEALKTCGDKSSIMIGAISNLERVGIIKDFYSCKINPIDSCVVNSKELRQEYREPYIVDDLTYDFLQEVGKSKTILTIDLQKGNFTTPIRRNRWNIEDLITLHKILEASEWYLAHQLNVLKLSVIIDKHNDVIFIISFTSPQECIAATNFLIDLKEIINTTRKKNAIF